MLVLAQFFIYEYITTRMKQKRKDFFTKFVRDKSSYLEIFQSLLPLIAGILFVSALTILVMKGISK